MLPIPELAGSSLRFSRHKLCLLLLTLYIHVTYYLITVYSINDNTAYKKKDYKTFTMRISSKDMKILEAKAAKLGMKKAEFIKHLIRLKDLEIK